MIRVLIANLVLLLFASRLAATTPRELESRWTAAWFQGKEARQPFSFNYGGRPSSAFLAEWTFNSNSRTIDASRVEHTLNYTDPSSQLEMRCILTEYTDYPALEWVLYFANKGPQDTPILDTILPLNAGFGSASAGEPILYYADGSHVLVSDFQPRQVNLSGTLVSLSSRGGRSSDGTLPFFNLAQPDDTGIVLGIGWTGQWAAQFATVGATNVNIRAGMESNHFILHPGEEVRSPAVLIQFWSGGDRVRAQNDFRRLLSAHYTPMPGGLPVKPPLCASPYGVLHLEDTTEAKMIQSINSLASNNIPVDTWWLDAGWYPCDGNWVKTGTWKPDPVRFPHGLKPVADDAHSKGMKFLVWFEPERAMTGTWLYNNHRDWLIGPIAGSGLLNLGNPAALAWAENGFAGLIRNVGIDIYRQDLNGNDPMVYWKTLDTPDRLGMTEIKYITGLYAYFDYLRARNPNLLLDNCSSGGRRIDFEMLRRATVMTRSDYTEPIGLQCQTYGLSQWIPLTGYGSTSVEAYNFRSGLGAFTTISFDWYNNPAIWAPTKRMLQQYDSVRPLFTGDFYPLGPYSTAANVWIAWQYDHADIGEGLIQVFRRPDSLRDNATYKLSGLRAASVYDVIDLDSGAVITKSGAALMEEGLPVKIPIKPGSALLRYQRRE